jgi:NAD(P)-dependent dehydrogenase (short-subunit alcohol dehydrogenase family)
VSDVDGRAAAAVAAEIVGSGGRATHVACNVADEGDVDRLFRGLDAQVGRLDILVNNAGIYPRVPFRETTTELFDRIMAVNFRGAFLCTMAALPLFERAGGGSIVFLSSGAASLAAVHDPLAGTLPVYGASKAALDRWALGVATELAQSGIAANVIYPGAVVLTDGTRALALADEELQQAVEPEAIAPAVVWLAAQRGGGFTGELVRAIEFGTSWGPGS